MIKANTMQKLLGHSQASSFTLRVLKDDFYTHTHTHTICAQEMYCKVTLPGPQHDNCPSKFWGMINHEPEYLHIHTHTLLARKPTSHKID
jgi:hypothetical protein